MKYTKTSIRLLLASIMSINSAFAVTEFNCSCAEGSNYYSDELGNISYRDRVYGDFANYLSTVYNGDYRMHCVDYFDRTKEPGMYLRGGAIGGYGWTWTEDASTFANLTAYSNSGHGFHSVEDWLTGQFFSAEDGYPLAASIDQEAWSTPYPLTTAVWDWRHPGYFSVAQTQENSNGDINQAISIYDSDLTGIASCVNVVPNKVIIGDHSAVSGKDTSGYSCNYNGLVDPEDFDSCYTLSYKHELPIKFSLLDTIDVDLSAGKIEVDNIHYYESTSKPFDDPNSPDLCVYVRAIAEGVKASVGGMQVFPVIPGEDTLDSGWVRYTGNSVSMEVARTPEFYWPSVQTLVFDTWLGMSEARGMEPDKNSIGLSLGLGIDGVLSTGLTWHVKGDADIDISTLCSFLVEYDTQLVFPAASPGNVFVATASAGFNNAMCAPPGS